MTIPSFDHRELKVMYEIPEGPRMPAIKIYDYPVTIREGIVAAFRRKPLWQVIDPEVKIFTPGIIPDNVARSFVFEANSFDPMNGGGKDMFGIEWEYIPVAGGSMVRPGKAFMEDANEWYEKLKWPDIDSWNWEKSAKDNNGTYLKPDVFNMAWFQTGFFERLISFMDFEGAVMSMIDEDQKEAVRELFNKLADLYIRIFDKYLTYYENIDGFYFHDDWGAQKETFFSPDTALDLIVPPMKRVTDFIHSKGRFAELHSCGRLLKQVPNMIAAGWDAWGGQAINDFEKIYDLYGDKILLGVVPEMFDPKTTSETEQRAIAERYVEKYCNPEKPSFLHRYGAQYLTPAFRETLYVESRKRYSR
jgi:hypothetical protein